MSTSPCHVGQAPLTLRLPIDQLTYIFAKTSGGQEGKAVFAAPEMPDDTHSFSIKTKIPYPSGQKRVNNARKQFYWAWGGLWVTGITAWVTNGIYTSHYEAAVNSSSPEFLSKAQGMYYISTGALVLFGAAVVYDVYQMVRYLGTASSTATPIIKQEKPKQ